MKINRPLAAKANSLERLLIFFGAAGLLTLSALIVATQGCSSSTALTASKANGAVVVTVDQAMTAWGIYTQTHSNVPPASILAVSNAYNVYYNSELVLSNLSVSYVANPTTNVSAALSAATAGVAANQTNLVNIITQLSQ